VFAFSVLALLMLAAGGVAIMMLQLAMQDIRQLTDVRLTRLQDSQALLRGTLAIERRTSELLHAADLQQVSQAYGGIDQQLDAFDETVQRLADHTDDASVLDLHQASQLFRNSANVVARLRESELQRAAGSLPVAANPMVARVRTELQQQADALVSVAQAQSERLTRDYRQAVQRLADTSRDTQYTVLGLLVSALVLAALLARLVGRLILDRLHEVSQRLLSGRTDSPAPTPAGHDEISEMARAVERFLEDRRQLQVRSVELVEEVSVRERAERIQADQARVLKLIAMNTGLGEVLECLCLLIEAQIPGTMTSVLLLLDSSEAPRLRHGAAPSLPPEYIRLVDGVPVGPSVGSCGTAAFRRQPVIVADIETDPLWTDYRDMALAHGLHSCWSSPVLSASGAVLGTFAVYRREPAEPTAAEHELVAQAAHVAGIAIERQMAQQRIQHMAHHDVLTGLSNRQGLEGQIERALAHGEQTGRGVALAYIDLDNFKFVNDSLGHAAGDQVLCEVARRLQAGVRGADTVARLGGDEFLVIFTDQPSDPVALAARLHRLREEVGQPIQIGDRPFRATCSIGVASFPNDAQHAAALMNCADTALYRAKDCGRDAVQFYSAELDANRKGQIRMREDLRVALERNEFFLLYQPQVDLATGQLLGVEALLRWRHPERGLVSPMDFIPLAEQTGLIVPIGEWVLRTACRQAAQWQAAGLPPIPVAVNASARQFREPHWARQVKSILDESGLHGSLLEIELTEGKIMENTEQAVGCMRELNEMGVGIAIDDFGTGYSSLGALKDFPINTLKIDKSFVWALQDSGGPAIVEAIVGLGHKLGLKVLAEGVETEAQREFLRLCQCDAMQGYLFSKPVPAREIERLAAGPGAEPARAGRHSTLEAAFSVLS